MSEEKKQPEVNCEQEQTLNNNMKQEEITKEKEEEIDIEKLKELCKEKICPECPVKQEMEQEMLRVKADADNFRKRMEREKENFCKYATEKVLEDIVPVIDNLELGLEHAKKLEACKDIVEGIEMTLNILLNTLKNHGLEQIKTKVGEPFDPNYHEAMAQQEREDMEPGMVSTVMQKGYKIKDRILRPAKVMVSKKQENKN